MRLHEQISYNFAELANFLGSPDVPLIDRPRVEVRFKTVERQYPSPFHPECFWHILNSLLILRRRDLKVHGWISVHPCWLNEWVQLLVSHYFYLSKYCRNAVCDVKEEQCVVCCK